MLVGLGPLVLLLEHSSGMFSGPLFWESFSILGSRTFEFQVSQLIWRYCEPGPILPLGDFQVVVQARQSATVTVTVIIFSSCCPGSASLWLDSSQL